MIEIKALLESIREGLGLRSLAEDGPEFTDDERRVLDVMGGKKMSDRKVTAALGMEQNHIHKLLHGLRKKLNLPPGGSVRDAAKKLKKAAPKLAPKSAPRPEARVRQAGCRR